MNAQQEAVALFRFFESRGMKPSVASIGRALRDQGIKFREADLYGWLKPFAEDTGKRPEEKITNAGRGAQDSGSDYAREKDVSLVSKPEATVVASRVEPTPEQPLLVAVPAPPPTPAKAPKQAKLGLDDAAKREVIAARQLIDRLWHHLERTGDKPRATTKTGWAQKQMRPAREMVRAGITQEQFEADLEQFRDARGYYPRMLGWLAEFMERRPRDNRPPRPQLEPGETCWWSEDGERWMVESPHDPPTRFELEAEHG